MIVQMIIIMIIFGIAAFGFGFTVACLIASEPDEPREPEGFKHKSLTVDNDHLRKDFER